MINNLREVLKNERSNLLLFSIPFLLLNIIKVFVFHAEMVYYQQDFSNIIYVLLFVGSWTGLLFLQLQRKKTALWIFWIIQLLYLSVNFSYLHFYGSYLSIRQFFSIFHEFLDIARTGAVPLHPKLLLFLIDLPFIIILTIKKRFPIHSSTFRKWVSLLCVFILLLLYAYRIPELNDNILRSKKSRFIGNFGLLTMQIYDFAVSGNFARQLSTENLPKHTGSGTTGTNRNVIFIQVETLDANALQSQYQGEPVMPFLSKLASENIYFPYMLAYHEGGGTSDADFTVMNAIEPLDDYAAINLPSYEYPNSLVKRFAAAGYQTYAFHGNVARYWNRDYAFPKMGFDRFWDIEAMGLKEYGWGARDEDLLSFVSSFRPNEDRPYFYYIITMSSHGPYKNVGLYYQNHRFDEIPESNPDRLYFRAMAYLDSCLETFFNNSMTDLSNTVIFIFGDHSEYYSMNSDAHRAVYLDGALKLEFVPLIIVSTSDDEIFSPVRNDWAASFLDLAPTALAISGISYSIKTEGLDLLKVVDPGTAVGIPFNGKTFNRKDLFRMAEGTK